MVDRTKRRPASSYDKKVYLVTKVGIIQPADTGTRFRRDGVRFGCERGGLISRYDIDGTAEQIATLSDNPHGCNVTSANQERLVVAHDDKLSLLSLENRETVDASEGLLRHDNGDLIQIRDAYDTHMGLFLVISSQPQIGMDEDVLLKWDPGADRWERTTLPDHLEDLEHRVFAASQTTLYAGTPGGIWKFHGGDWTRLVDMTGIDGAPAKLDAWNDELLISTDYFQLYRYVPPSE